jgi:hypothetical protein
MNASYLHDTIFFITIGKLVKYKDVDITEGTQGKLLVHFYFNQIDDTNIIQILKIFKKYKKTFSLYAEKGQIELFYVDCKE